ncbi:MAG TPA: cytochrome c peroxidase [Gemmatimonadaceae bacterium]|nr:cytochrome c peroxidase [Gemmatimonadaceae bacterium]
MIRIHSSNALATPFLLLALLASGVVAGCSNTMTDGGGVTPPPPLTLDDQVRAQFNIWGVVPIGAVTPPNAALVDLGRSLFFDKVLSGNRDVSCATCHSPLSHGADVLALSVGTGGSGDGAARTLGTDRQFTPRNAPSLLNTGLGAFFLFWDGRVSEFGGATNFKTPAGASLPSGLTSVLAAQAMFPVTNRNEMRGEVGDRDVFGNPNELAAFDSTQYGAIWSAVMQRLVAINGYVAKFNAAFPGVPVASLGFQHAANAIAAFEKTAFTFTNSPFDRYVAHDDRAMTTEAKQGALLFFTKARCSSCHFGPLLGGQSFASAGVPQLGPGIGKEAPLDLGQEPQFQGQTQRFLFRVPALRNVELTAPYMHDGAFATLDAVVRHYNNVEQTLRNYDVSQLDPRLRAQYRGDAATIEAILAATNPTIRQPLGLSETEIHQLVAFLESLTDPAARDLSAMIPASVPSGLPR